MCLIIADISIDGVAHTDTFVGSYITGSFTRFKSFNKKIRTASPLVHQPETWLIVHIQVKLLPLNLK